MITMEQITKAAGEFARERKLLLEHVEETNARINQILRRRIGAMRDLVGRVAECKSIVTGMIEQAPGLFEKPRTVVVEGVKVGLRKGTGGLAWDDDDQVVKLIEKHFAEQADVLVRTTKKPVKGALGELTVAELKRLGVTVEETGDVPVVNPVDGAVEKIVKALLKSAEDAA